MIRVFTTLTALTLSVACLQTGKVTGPPPDRVEPRPAPTSASDARALAAFSVQLKEYAALHDRLDKMIAPVSHEATAHARDDHRLKIAQLIGENRKHAKRGDLLTPEGERVIRRLLAQVLSGAEGAKLKSSIRDESQLVVKLAVNARFPDDVPVSTMPPQILAVLPKLPEDLEYRFIGARLVLLDVHAHMVADFIENVLPQ